MAECGMRAKQSVPAVLSEIASAVRHMERRLKSLEELETLARAYTAAVYELDNPPVGSSTQDLMRHALECDERLRERVARAMRRAATSAEHEGAA